MSTTPANPPAASAAPARRSPAPRPPVRRSEHQEAVATKVASALAVLEREVSALRSGEDWQRYLAFSAKLHAYSPNNVMLIAAQHAHAYGEGKVSTPVPSYVAGYRSWQALGRQVEKGQKGYVVLAPLRYKRREAVAPDGRARRLRRDEQPAQQETERSSQVLGGFTIEHVFAVEQTTGAQLPPPQTPVLLSGEAPRGLGAAVLALIEARGYEVDSVPSAVELAGANGVTIWEQRLIRVRSDMDDAAMTKTLIHEAAHVLLHEGPAGSRISRAQKEVEAESVAFVVAAAHGMASDGYSFPYVAAWAGADPHKAVAASQARISHAASAILAASPAVHGGGGRVPGAHVALEAARAAQGAHVELPGQVQVPGSLTLPGSLVLPGSVQVPGSLALPGSFQAPGSLQAGEVAAHFLGVTS